MNRNEIVQKLETTEPVTWDKIQESKAITKSNSPTFNVNEQYIVAIEELSELQKELASFILGNKDVIGIEEEIADVMLALNMVVPMTKRDRWTNPKYVDMIFDDKPINTIEVVAYIIEHLASLQQCITKGVRDSWFKCGIHMVAHDVYDCLVILVDELNLSKVEIEKIISIKIDRQIARKTK